MGLRFRKSKSFGPFRVNISKSGVGWSVGGKGFRYTKRADGKTQTTASIPGTGISYVDVQGKSNRSKKTDNMSIGDSSNFNGNNQNKEPFYKRPWFIWFMLIFFPPIGIIMLWFRKDYSIKKRSILSAVFAIYFVIIMVNQTPAPTEGDKNTATKPPIEQSETSKVDSNKVSDEKPKENVTSNEDKKDTQSTSENTSDSNSNTAIIPAIIPVEETPTPQVEEPVVEQPVTETPVANETKVYIAGSGNGKKYHSNPNCSNMTNPIEKNLSEVEGSYEPCKKCY